MKFRQAFPTVTFTRWSTADIPDLQRLLGNPYYAAAAQRQLARMGP